MPGTETESVLLKIRTALDAFEDVPLSASLRRAIRIGYLIAEPDVSWRLTLESKPMGGSKALLVSQAEELWPEHDYEAVRERNREMVDDFIEDRKLDMPETIAGRYFGSSLTNTFISGSAAEIEQRIATFEGDRERPSVTSDELHMATVQLRAHREILDRIRHRVFSTLCLWERRLTFAATNVRIFDQHRSRVDRMLSRVAPDVVDQLSAAYRRVEEGDIESLSQGLTSCRRILKAAADHLYPPREPTMGKDGVERSMGDDQYVNRLWQFASEAIEGRSRRRLIIITLREFGSRIDCLYALTNKGVHDAVSLEEVNLCVIQTYLMVGELLALQEPGDHEPVHTTVLE